MIPQPRMAALVSVLVLLVSTAVYMMTLTPTVPFWDSGEFIAVAPILGVPHPPGTPFYVLLGRIATLVPWASIAERVNALSAIAAALAVFLTYLSSLRLIRLAQGGERQPWHEWVAIAAAGTGALLLAFSDAFWENAIEAEVYSLMSLAQILVFWLGLRWWEAHDRKPTVGPLDLAEQLLNLAVLIGQVFDCVAVNLPRHGFPPGLSVPPGSTCTRSACLTRPHVGPSRAVAR